MKWCKRSLSTDSAILFCRPTAQPIQSLWWFLEKSSRGVTSPVEYITRLSGAIKLDAQCRDHCRRNNALTPCAASVFTRCVGSSINTSAWEEEWAEIITFRRASTSRPALPLTIFDGLRRHERFGALHVFFRNIKWSKRESGFLKVPSAVRRPHDNPWNLDPYYSMQTIKYVATVDFLLSSRF